MDNKIPVPLWIEFLNVVVSKTTSEKVGITPDRIIGSNDPEVFVNQVSNLPTAKETVLLLGVFVPPD